MSEASLAGIFLSYRREDAAPYARSLEVELRHRFPGAQVFMDVDSIEPGVDFAEVIEHAVGSCAALIVLIGRQWATLADERGDRRLDDPDDFVRFEVKTALERGVQVIPVLVDGATPPRRQELPVELHTLSRLNALELSHGRHYQYDADRLLDRIERVLTSVVQAQQSGGQIRKEDDADPNTPAAQAPNTSKRPAEPTAELPPRSPAPISYLTEFQNEISGPAPIERDRQLALVGELKARLRTNDRPAALLLLRTLASRNDLVYEAFIEVDAVLTSEGSDGDSAARGSARLGSADVPTVPAQSTPPGEPGFSEPAIAMGRRAATGRARPIAWGVLALGFVLLLLSLFALKWVDWSDSPFSYPVAFFRVGGIVPGGSVLGVYFNGLGYILDLLALVLAVLACAIARGSTALTWWSVGSAIGALVACVVATVLLIHWLESNVAVGLSLNPGFFVCLAALVLLVVAVLIPRRPG